MPVAAAARRRSCLALHEPRHHHQDVIVVGQDIAGVDADTDLRSMRPCPGVAMALLSRLVIYPEKQLGWMARRGFSALFPKPPKEESKKDDKAVYHYFRLLDDHVLYQVAHSEAVEPLEASRELKDAVDGVVSSMKGRLLNSENVQFDVGGGRRLPAVTFSVENDKVFMTGKFIIDGKHLYGITLATARGSERRIATDRFIQSLKLMPPSPQ
jgi:hypothetical protein